MEHRRPGTAGVPPARVPRSPDRDLVIDASHLVIVDAGRRGRLRSQEDDALLFSQLLPFGGFRMELVIPKRQSTYRAIKLVLAWTIALVSLAPCVQESQA